MKKRIVVYLILCLACALASTSALAQSEDDSVLILPWKQDEITVSADQELILGWEWIACTPGLVQAYLTAVHPQWSLDDEPILSDEEASQYWGPIESRGEGDGCLVGRGTTWGSSWRYSIGTLAPGVYEIRLLHWLDHPVIDGGDWDGDGKIDRWAGPMSDDTVTVYVEAP